VTFSESCSLRDFDFSEIIAKYPSTINIMEFLKSLSSMEQQQQQYVVAAIVGGACLVVGLLFSRKKAPVLPNDDLVHLYTFNRWRGLPDPSPFCTKFETWLRLTKIPYKLHEMPEYINTMKSPTGKTPFMVYKGKLVPDSQCGIEYLKTQFPKESDLDAGLSPLQLAQSHSFRKMLEESTYFVVLRQRWMEEKNWAIVRREYFGALIPAPLFRLVTWSIRRSVVASCWGQGIGRHTEEYYQKIGMQDSDALSNFLGNKKFIMGGDKPTSLDAVVYAFVIHCVWVPFDNPVRDHILKNHKNLLEYIDRMQQLCFPELVPEYKPK